MFTALFGVFWHGDFGGGGRAVELVDGAAHVSIEQLLHAVRTGHAARAQRLFRRRIEDLDERAALELVLEHAQHTSSSSFFLLLLLLLRFLRLYASSSKHTWASRLTSSSSRARATYVRVATSFNFFLLVLNFYAAAAIACLLVVVFCAKQEMMSLFFFLYRGWSKKEGLSTCMYIYMDVNVLIRKGLKATAEM